MTAPEGGNGALVVTTGTRRYQVTDPQLLITRAWQAVARRSGADAPLRCLADTGQISPHLAVSVLTAHMADHKVARRAPELGLCYLGAAPVP